MYIQKHFNVLSILNFSGGHIIWLTAWASAVAWLYHYTGWEWMKLPMLPLTVIGTAVAFYVGFKNNSAYDRLWEARKIWGAIVNSSRMWGTTVKAYVDDELFSEEEVDATELQMLKKRLIYRHIGWLYALRAQLLVPTPWEHLNQNRMVAKVTKKRMERFGLGLNLDGVTEKELNEFLPKEEMERLLKHKNTATQIIDQQSQDVLALRKRHLIDDFRHMELQKLLNDFYTHQGKAERIKKFPLPRQYGSMSFVFVAIFIFLLPLGMVSTFENLTDYGVWLSIPFTVLIGWVFLMMELIGDYSENPFEGMGNDIPMLSLCRTIEIDLREMLGETELPPAIEAKKGILM